MYPQLRIIFCAIFAFMLIWQPMLQIRAQSNSPENLMTGATAADASIADALLTDVGDIRSEEHSLNSSHGGISRMPSSA